MTDEEKCQEIAEEYRDLAHAMQTGVKFTMDLNQTNGELGDTTPKHLRVGVNSALVDTSGLADLLIAKGVITKLEYVTAIRDKMREEVENYERALSEKLGSNVKLR